jgi:hypothetical protein
VAIVAILIVALFGINRLFVADATVPVLVIVLWGIVGCIIGWCFPGNRKRNAKMGFDVGALFAAFGLLCPLLGQSHASASAHDAEQVQQASIAFTKTGTQLIAQFNGELSVIWSNGLLQPANLDTKAKIDDARSKVLKSRRLCDEYEQRICGQLESWPKYLKKVSVNESEKQSIVATGEAAAKRAVVTTHDLFSVHRQFHGTILDMLSFLESRLGQFVVRDGRILFAAGADLQKYDRYIDTVDQQAEKVQQLQKELGQQSRFDQPN